MGLNQLKWIGMAWACCLVLSCKSTGLATAPAPIEHSILGSWEGCDGRVVTFTREPDGLILGHYSELGGLGKYGFTRLEEGYRIRRQGRGTYNGKVKWRDTNGNASWKNVEITIEIDNVFRSDGSDSCSAEMTRLDP